MSDKNYTLKGNDPTGSFQLPHFDYLPKKPKSYRPRIGMIGCGGITKQHLQAYKDDGYTVVALCDINEEAALERQKEYFPEADLYTDYHELLRRDDIDVVDIPLHVEPRGDAIEAALNAGKHVLSQKPFVLNLERGKELVELAERKGLKLAVNQNGRWASYVRWMTLAIQNGLIGEVQSLNIQLNWDHTWVKGTAFEKMQDLILYDFAVHWIDMTRILLGAQKAVSVSAIAVDAPDSEIAVPMIAGASVAFEKGLANLVFDGHSKFADGEHWTLCGSKGTIRASGSVTNANAIEVTTAEGKAGLTVEGGWFPTGFRGTMGELLCAIEEEREPFNSGRNNLASLELVFAALESAQSGRVVRL